MSRTFAIGDIHGCPRALDALVDQIQPTADDIMVPLGDYVDRGDDSKAVLDRLLELATRCQLQPLLGNHELMLLSALDSAEGLRFWLQCGGAATVESYGGDLYNISDAHLSFIRSCHRFFETDDHIFVHANYDPKLPLDLQPDRLLFWEHLMLFDHGMHTIPARHSTGKVAVVGHTPQENGEILDLGDVICIDTYCFGGGWLTALEVATGQIIQADREGNLRYK
jgi:serine/threonine protein phosphatase 1